MKYYFYPLLLIAASFFIGCDDGAVMSGGSSSSNENTPSATSAEEQVANTPVPAAPEETFKKADVGVTGKGKFADSAEKPMSIITVPLATYFRGKEMTVFRIQIPHTMELYKGANGQYPESHEVFMREIIQANQIALPSLPPGDTYVYDPAAATLLVKTKK